MPTAAGESHSPFPVVAGVLGCCLNRLGYGQGVPHIDHQRVVGWLALTLQRSSGRLSGFLVEYTVTDSGGVELSWRGGPLPADVAAIVVDAADLDLPVTMVKPASDVRADLLVGDVPVALVAYDPDPTAPAELLRAANTWSWPHNPLQTDGAALDKVLWHVTPDPGGVGVATVIRVPTSVRDQASWIESTHWVVHTEHTVPSYASPDKHLAWRRADQTASVRVRPAATDWTTDDADTWLDNDLLNRSPSPSITAVVMHDRCLMRIRTGLRIEATVHDPAPAVPWDFVPSTVLSAVCETDDRRQPPATVIIRPFGDIHGECRFRLATTLAIPTRTFG